MQSAIRPWISVAIHKVSGGGGKYNIKMQSNTPRNLSWRRCSRNRLVKTSLNTMVHELTPHFPHPIFLQICQENVFSISMTVAEDLKFFFYVTNSTVWMFGD